MNIKASKLIRSLVILTLVSGSIIAGTSAYFSDIETSSGNTLTAGSIDLKIDNTSYYNYLKCMNGTWQNPGLVDLDPSMEDYINQECKTSWGLKDLDNDTLFFDFNDLKPGDWGEDTISVHVVDNDSWLCMEIETVGTPENGVIEPELDVDNTHGPNDGELQDYLKFVFWGDDGDNVLEDNENPIVQNVTIDELREIVLADSTFNAWGDGPIPISGGAIDDETSTYYIGKAWCFGDLTLKPLAQSDNNSPTIDPGIRCDGANVGNASQTDGILADVTFKAVQSRNNGFFKCFGCQEEDTGYAANVISSNPGTLNNGSPIIDPERINTDYAVGEANGKFFSLGFGGEIVLQLDGPITGDNVSVIEITNGRSSYPEETAEVFVSDNRTNWVSVGNASSKDSGGVSEMSVSGIGLSNILYVKIVDTTIKALHDDTADGFDVDAISATVCLDEQRQTY